MRTLWAISFFALGAALIVLVLYLRYRYRNKKHHKESPHRQSSAIALTELADTPRNVPLDQPYNGKLPENLEKGQVHEDIHLSTLLDFSWVPKGERVTVQTGPSRKTVYQEVKMMKAVDEIWTEEEERN